jgi:hypothetical protein
MWRALFFALTGGPPSVLAQTKESAPLVLPGQAEDEFLIKDFHLKSGEVLPTLRLHYVTLGAPHRNPAGDIDNAALLLHATGGGAISLLSHLRGPLFGAGQSLDLTQWYLIVPDSIGHGKSSKPSDGMRAHFPHYGYEDMVAAQHRLVTRRPVTEAILSQLSAASRFRLTYTLYARCLLCADVLHCLYESLPKSKLGTVKLQCIEAFVFCVVDYRFGLCFELCG